MFPIKRKLIFLIIIIAVFYLGNLFALDFLRDDKSIEQKDKTIVEKNNNQNAKRELEADNLNILLAGLDDDKTKNNQNRTDVLLILKLDQTAKKIDLVSIPRDTMVAGYDLKPAKINAAYAAGGIEFTSEIVEELTQTDIHANLIIDYNVFIEIVDAIGGVEIDVAQEMFYQDKSDDLLIDIKGGRQELSGGQALNYVRFRDKITGDIGRIKRQHKFFEYFKKKLLIPRNLFKLPKISLSLYKNIETDLGLSEVWQLSYLLQDLDEYEVDTAMLAGEAKLIDGISYWVLEDE